MNKAPSWLLFDLGGVLMNFSGVQGLSELTGKPSSEIHDLLIYSDAINNFQRGTAEPEDFATELVTELGLSISSSEMLHLWAEWETGPMSGALELLDSLRPKSSMACLSNTNIVHWARLTGRYAIHTKFDRCYVSHEIGLSKPDPRIFAHVVDDLGTEPGHIIYFDDNHDIVEAAHAFGFNAHQVNSPDDIEMVLQELRPSASQFQ